MIKQLLAGTLLLSTATNIALLSDISKVNRRTDDVVNKLNRAHLIATYYVLKEDPTKSLNSKEETKMKFMSKISNRTKVMGAMTILLGTATGISMLKDRRSVKELEANDIADVIENIRDGIEGDVLTIDF